MSALQFKEQGNKALQAGQFDEAIEAYSKAIEINPNDQVFFSNRSAAYLSKGDADNALSDGNRCIEINPNWAKGYSRKGAALHALKRYEEALEVYNTGLTHFPEDAGLKSGRDEVKKILDSKQGPLGGLFGPQMLSKLVGHPKFGPKLADPAFMRKLQMVNSNPSLMMQDPELMEVISALIGGEGDDKELGEPATYAAPTPAPAPAPKKTAPQPEPEPEDLTEEERQLRKRKADALAVKERGNALYKQRQFDEAIAAYDEAYELDPSNVMLLNNKAAVLIEQGRTDEAVALCEQALEAGKQHRLGFPERAKVYQRIAAARQKGGDLAGAVKALRSAQMEDADKAVERKLKNLELEVKKQEKAQYIDPALGLEAKEKGNAAFREGRYPDAITAYEEACKRDPTNASYFNNLAAALQKMGLFNDAKREVERSLELDRSYVKAWAKKGDIEFFMKEYHKALDSYRAGLQIEPDNALCKAGLNKTAAAIQSGQSQAPDQERAAHAMADPEIQAILSDPSIRQILTDFQENPAHAQRALAGDASIRAKIEKLVAAGVLQVK